MSTALNTVSFQDKKVLITGAGRGIGRAVTKDMYSKGAFIYALSKNSENLNTLKEECPNIHTICVDLSNWDEARIYLENNVDYVDALINNAGICPSGGLQDINSEEFDKLFDINVKSVINVSQVISKKMIAKGKGGSIVNVSSIYGLKAAPSAVAYCCSKAAIEMLTKCMAVELGQNKITVNAVCPGPVDTEMCRPQNPTPEISSAFEKFQEGMRTRTPTKTFFMPMADIVNTIAFLASGVTTQITGESIVIDGGYTKA